MNAKRFNVKQALVNQFPEDYVGWYVLDSFTGHPVGDGKGNLIHVYGDRIVEVESICAEMNERTSGITIAESAAFTPQVLVEAA